MKRSVMSISLLVLACLVVSAAAQTAETTTDLFAQEKNDQQCHCEPTPPGTGESNVKAYLKDFQPNQNNWNYPSYAACIDLDGDKPLEWRKRYGWTGFCGKAGPRGRNACGCCIKVTNSATKASEIVRVIHTCGSGALELDRETAFTPIDTTGEGNDADYLTVDYEFVECGDSVHSSLPVYSQ
ncbi:HEVEIN-LIKE, pathogenesis-related 4 [Hibiscus trionum]|uniref:HEVEIN-LIKE, pathogenesis-related 4 n=1 Tax=Hibiscus trionum TaxID=183268 RepID=A0A9W7LI88_HIBTR|nr:HEVEIN-LIKE, pathogenesis-related 4 [Hibiscus trionum]